MTRVSLHVIASCLVNAMTSVSNLYDTGVKLCLCTPLGPPGISIYMLKTGLYRLRSDIYMSGGAYICKIFARAARAQRALYFYSVYPIYAPGDHTFTTSAA